MKKTLAILGLLVCSAGIVFADEVASADAVSNVTQQVEIQNSLDRTNFEKMEMNNRFNKSLSEKSDKDKIKFDKSVNDKKYKNFDKKKPSITDKKYKHEVKGKKPTIYDRRPERFGEGRRPHPHYVGHHPEFNRYDQPSHKIRKPQPRHSHNKLSHKKAR